MNYTLHQLFIYTIVVEKKSVTRAAEELNMTQPAVSIQLRNLQNQFDIDLIQIVGRRIKITNFGEEIYLIAKRIILESEEIKHKANLFKGLLSGKLSIGAVSTGKYVMPFFLTDFLTYYKEINLIMDVSNKQEVLRKLEKNEIEFALVSILPENLSFQEEILLPNNLYLMGGTKMEYESVDISVIPLIYREAGSGTRTTMEKFLSNRNISVQKRIELTSNEAVKQAVIASLGYSVLPLIGVKNELRSGEVRIIRNPFFPIQSSWRLIWLRDHRLSPIAKAYIDFIHLNKESIVLEHFSWLSQYE